MRAKSEERRRKNEERRFSSAFFVSLFLILSSLFYPLLTFGAEKWSGIDETVVERYAKEHGREAREPIINTDKGDLLLFLFLLAGAVGGFAAGYCWRRLIEDEEREGGIERDGTIF